MSLHFIISDTPVTDFVNGIVAINKTINTEIPT